MQLSSFIRQAGRHRRWKDRKTERRDRKEAKEKIEKIDEVFGVVVGLPLVPMPMPMAMAMAMPKPNAQCQMLKRQVLKRSNAKWQRCSFAPEYQQFLSCQPSSIATKFNSFQKDTGCDSFYVVGYGGLDAIFFLFVQGGRMRR